MKDLTVIYLTNNELPEEWNKFQQKVLLEAIGGASLITVSRKPMPLPGANIIQTEPKSSSNVYWQILKAAKVATTEYVAIAEDDSLYPAEHFQYRPLKDTVAYNKTHWSLFTWGEPIYNWRDRKGNYTMIASRDLVIAALEERFAKYPNGTPDDITGEIGRTRIEKQMGITPRKTEEFYTSVAVINFNHDYALDDRQRRHRKSLGHLRAYDIPYWGSAEELVKKFI